MTGAAGGFGRPLVETVLERGDAVAACDLTAPPIESDRCLPLAADVTDPEAMREAARAAVERFGRIDVVVTCAGVGLGGPFEETDPEAMRRVIDVNLLGTMHTAWAALPHLRRQGSGRLVLMSSDSGQVGFPFQNVYTASKFGVEGLAESVKLEVEPFGIDVTVVEPCGAFDTGMPRGAVAAAREAIPADSPYRERAMAIADQLESGEFQSPQLVVDAIWEVAGATQPPFRRRVGPDDRTGLLSAKRRLPDEAFFDLIRYGTATGHEGRVPVEGQGTGGDLFVRTLAAAGVEVCFTIVGGHDYELVEAARRYGMRVVDVRHEQAAAHMADAYARFTRRPALVAVDGAPGVVNAFPGIQVASEAQVPMIVATAQGSLEGRDIGVMQAIDQLRVVRPVTKWQRTCFEAARMAEYAATAYRHAVSGRPGPVFCDFPLEVMRATVDLGEVAEPRGFVPEGRPHPDPALVERAVELLAASERPMVIAGSGVWWADAGDELAAFCEETGIPVMCRNLARGVVADDHPLAAGFMPYPANLADTFLVVGTRLDWTIGYGRFPLFDADATVIQVDVHPESIGKTRPVDVGIVADAGAALRALRAAADEATFRVDPGYVAAAHGAVREARRRQLEDLGIADREADRPMHSLQVLEAYRAWAPREAVTVVDGGYSAAFAIEHLDARSPGGVTWVGSTGHLGVGVAYAAAAKLAEPDRPVVALMGDGAFGLAGLELDTAVRHGLAIVVVVFNDAGWGETRDGQRRRWGDEALIGTDLAPTRYDQLAQSLGGHGELVTTPDELGPALDRALASGTAAVVNCLTDPDQRSGIVSGLPWVIE